MQYECGHWKRSSEKDKFLLSRSIHGQCQFLRAFSPCKCMLSFLPKSFISYPLLCNKLGYQAPESSEENSCLLLIQRRGNFFLFFSFFFFFCSILCSEWLIFQLIIKVGGEQKSAPHALPPHRASAQRYTSLPQHLVHLQKPGHSRVKALLLSTHSAPKLPLPPPLCR